MKWDWVRKKYAMVVCGTSSLDDFSNISGRAGKTVQVSSFLGAMAASRKLKGVLIISPATMLQHWLSELTVWAPGLRRVLLHSSGDGGSVETPRNITNQGPAIFRNLRDWLKMARKERLYERIENLEGGDNDEPEDSFCGTGYAVITTYEHVRRNQDDYVNHPWSYVVMDEAQKIRNPQADVTLACKRLRTPHRIAMTGTPIQNDLKGELVKPSRSFSCCTKSRVLILHFRPRLI
jgi:DNA excision repair protein ERCC-6